MMTGYKLAGVSDGIVTKFYLQKPIYIYIYIHKLECGTIFLGISLFHVMSISWNYKLSINYLITSHIYIYIYIYIYKYIYVCIYPYLTSSANQYWVSINAIAHQS